MEPSAAARLAGTPARMPLLIGAVCWAERDVDRAPGVQCIASWQRSVFHFENNVNLKPRRASRIISR